MNKILSFVRINIQIALMGDGVIADSFHLANKFLSLFKRIAIDGNFETLVVSYYKKSNNKSLFLLKIFIIITALLSFISIFVSIFATPIASFFLKKISLKEFFIKFLRLLSPLIPLMFLMSFFTAVLNSNHKFYISSPAPFIGNIINVLIITFAAKYIGVFWSVGLGSLSYAFMQVVFMFIFSYKYLKTQDSIFSITEEDKDFYQQTSKSSIIQNIVPVSETIVSGIVAHLATGSLSCFDYSHKIIQFVFSIIAVSLGSVLAPVLSEEKTNIEDKISESFVVTHILSMPACLLIIFYGESITLKLFGGFKNLSNPVLFSKTLQIVGVSLYFWIQSRILNIAAISRKKMNSSIIGSLIYAISNVVLCLFMRDSVLSIAWAGNIAIFLQFSFLIYRLYSLDLLKMNKSRILYLIISTLTGLGVVFSSVFLFGYIGKLMSFLPQYLHCLIKIADIMIPFALLYSLHLLINYKYSRILFNY